MSQQGPERLLDQILDQILLQTRGFTASIKAADWYVSFPVWDGEGERLSLCRLGGWGVRGVRGGFLTQDGGWRDKGGIHWPRNEKHFPPENRDARNGRGRAEGPRTRLAWRSHMVRHVDDETQRQITDTVDLNYPLINMRSCHHLELISLRTQK